MGGPTFLRYATLQTCEDIYKRCVDALTEGNGTIVISTSGGGESETRAGNSDGGVSVTKLMAAAMRRMHQLDPTKYPAISTSQRPDFSAMQL